MDSNLVAPFAMYTDEYIVWMERQKKEIRTKKECFSETALFSLLFIAMIAGFILLYFLFHLSLAASIGLPVYFLGLPLLGGLFARYKNRSKIIMYYITNYRLLELKNGKLPSLRYSYLLNLDKINIVNSRSGAVSLEFDWLNSSGYKNLCHEFHNIDNAKKMYNVIMEQKSKLQKKPAEHTDIIQ